MSTYPNLSAYFGDASGVSELDVTSGLTVSYGGFGAGPLLRGLLMQTDDGVAYFRKVLPKEPLGLDEGSPIVYGGAGATDCDSLGRVLAKRAPYAASFSSPAVSFGPIPDGQAIRVAVAVLGLSGDSPGGAISLISSRTVGFSRSTLQRQTTFSTAGLVWLEFDGPTSDRYWRVDVAITGSVELVLAIDRTNYILPVDQVGAPATAPDAPNGPSPGDTGIAGVSPTLSWLLDDALTFDVAFDTANPPTTVVSSGQADVSYAVAGPLTDGVTYYWQVTARNEIGATVGPVWSFTAMARAACVARPAPVSVPSIANGTADDSHTLVSPAFAKVSFIYADAVESLPSPSSAGLTWGSSNRLLVGLEIGPAGVVDRRVYVDLPGMHVPPSVPFEWFNGTGNPIGDNTSTSLEYQANATNGIGHGTPQTSPANYGAGVTYLYVDDISVANASGGTATVGSQSFTYTGRSGSSGVGAVTGIPSSGPGSISAPINVGDVVRF